MPKIVIIGASVAGHYSALNLREKDKDLAITLITEEPHRFYDRRRLTDFLNGKIKEEELFLCPENYYAQNNINLLKEKKVVSLNVKKRTLLFKDKETLEYDFLVIASGRKIEPADIPGVRKEGVFLLYSLKDYQELAEHLFSDTVCLVGSDKAALATAQAIQEKYKVEVKLVSRSVIDGAFIPPGIEMINGQLQEIIGEGYVQAVRLNQGKVIGVSAVVFSEELKNNLDLLRDTTVALQDDNLVVDNQMRTSIEGVFACGAICGAKDWDRVIQDSAILAENILKNLKERICQQKS